MYLQTILVVIMCASYMPCHSVINGHAMPLGTSTNVRNRFAEHPKAAEYALKFQGMFGALMANVANFLTPEVNVSQVYKTGNGHVQEFIRYLSLFINSCLKSHLSMLEQGMPRANGRACAHVNWMNIARSSGTSHYV